MQINSQIFAFLIILALHSTFAFKILVYSPTISRSHMISNARVADSLAKDGHDVTLLEVEYQVPMGILNASKLAKTIQVPGQFYQNIVDGNGMEIEMGKQIAEMSFNGPSAWHLWTAMKEFQQPMNAACERFVLRESALLKQFKAEKFDIIISEQLFFCGAGLTHLLAIPTHILLSSCPIQEHVASLLGLPNPSSFVPSILDTDLPDKMSIWQRMQNIFLQFGAYTFLHDGMDPMTEIFRKHFGQEFPDLRDIVKESPLVLVNVDELVDFPRPTFANIIYIGGLMGIEAGDKKMRELQEPFKSEMAKGKKGVVFFSMGSIVASTHLDETFRENIFNAFAQFPDYHFVVKVEKDDNFSSQIAAKIENVFIAHWMPQTEILSHPRLKLFITHGGYNSLMEAARSGVPLISMGFFADQYRNARVSERNGWGIAFDKKLLLRSSKEFADSIRKILNNPKYAENAKRTQKLVLNKPFSAEERLQKSIRFLELSGGKLPELLSESRNMDTIALYNLDIAFLAVTILLAFLVAIILMGRFLWQKIGKNLFNIILDGIQQTNEKNKNE